MEIWSGYAFENICFKHMLQLKKALGISNVFSEITSYTQKAKTDVSDGTQIRSVRNLLII